LRALRARNERQRVLVMSGYSDPNTMDRCAALGVTDFIAKPFELPVLLSKLQGLAA
jgi:CheY-like chemotaxis protein